MSFVQAIIIALLQGFSELFPVSSLGHAVILPKLLHWHLNEKAPYWLAFLVALHLGTAAALLIYFRAEWNGLIRAFIRSVQRGKIGNEPDERLAWMVIIGTIPAGIVGLLLQDPLRSLFGSPYVAASFLVLNGFIMVTGERLLMRQQLTFRGEASRVPIATAGGTVSRLKATNETPPAPPQYRSISDLSWRDAAFVGFAQVGALIPGISRSGITMVAGLAAGLTHEAAARYAFLLATPIIGAAGVLEVPKLFNHSGQHILGQAILGMFLAGIAAYLSVRFLMRYFEFGRLYPFAFYCVGAGVLSLILLSARL